MSSTVEGGWQWAEPRGSGSCEPWVGWPPGVSDVRSDGCPQRRRPVVRGAAATSAGTGERAAAGAGAVR